MRLLKYVFLLAVSFLCFSAEPPKAVFEKTVLEVGEVRKGEKVKVEFRFRNEGGETLRILSLTPA